MIARASSSDGIGTGHKVVPQTIAISISSASRSDDLISLRGAPPYSGDGSAGDCISLLRRLVGTLDGKARAGAGQGGNPPLRPDAPLKSSKKGGLKLAHQDVCLSVDAARAVIAAPHLHTVAGLRQSIEVLKTYGDWMDFERAKMLERQLDDEAARPTEVEFLIDAPDAITLFALVIAAFWIGLGLGWL